MEIKLKNFINASSAGFEYCLWMQYSAKYESYISLRVPNLGKDFFNTFTCSQFCWCKPRFLHLGIVRSGSPSDADNPQLSVSLPTIALLNGTRQNASVDDWDEGPSTSVGDGLKKHLFDSRSMPPNTQTPSTSFPQWYLLFLNLDSSISTVFPGPPIGSEWVSSIL